MTYGPDPSMYQPRGQSLYLSWKRGGAGKGEDYKRTKRVGERLFVCENGRTSIHGESVGTPRPRESAWKPERKDKTVRLLEPLQYLLVLWIVLFDCWSLRISAWMESGKGKET